MYTMLSASARNVLALALSVSCVTTTPTFGRVRQVGALKLNKWVPRVFSRRTRRAAPTYDSNPQATRMPEGTLVTVQEVEESVREHPGDANDFDVVLEHLEDEYGEILDLDDEMKMIMRGTIGYQNFRRGFNDGAERDWNLNDEQNVDIWNLFLTENEARIALQHRYYTWQVLQAYNDRVYSYLYLMHRKKVFGLQTNVTKANQPDKRKDLPRMPFEPVFSRNLGVLINQPASGVVFGDQVPIQIGTPVSDSEITSESRPTTVGVVL